MKRKENQGKTRISLYMPKNIIDKLTELADAENDYLTNWARRKLTELARGGK